jgi:hypothetical protein
MLPDPTPMALSLRDEYLATLPEHEGCGDRGCHYCGIECADCGVPHGYVQWLEERVEALQK